MSTVTRLKGMGYQRQRGAVAIMFAISLLVLFGFMALVFDLGRTYVVRTELQNAADAAALAGAKDLDQKLAGVTKAIATAKAIGLQNRTKFSFKGSAGIVITDPMISVSSCPDGCTWTQASSIGNDAQAAGKTFLKVDIPSGGLTTFFARVPTTLDGAGTSETRTYGLAVAGRFINEVTPIGVCAIDPLTKGGKRPTTNGIDELTEYGFRRGVSYNTFELGSVSGGSSDTYLLDPIGSHSSPCVPSNSNNVNTAQFVCSGSSATISAVPTLVWGNTGIQAMPTQKALNSRFGDSPPAQCIAELAPPDTNIRDYPCTPSACPKMAPVNSAALPNTWMDPLTVTTPNTRQTMNLAAVANGTATKDDYGVLWSFSRAVKAIGNSPNAKADTSVSGSFTPNDWNSLYPGLTAESTYPGGLAGTSGSPYSQPSGSYFRPGGAGSLPKRRVLNLAIADCRTPVGNGSCLSIPIVGIGRFFMQVPADITGARKIYVEFDGLVDPIPDAVIKLYR